MKPFLKYFKALYPHETILNKKDNLVLNQTNDPYNMTLIASDFLNSEDTIFVVLPNLYMAQLYYDGLSLLLEDNDVLFYPSDEILTSLLALTSIEFKIERIYALGTLLDKQKKIVVTHQTGILRKNHSIDKWLSSIKVINVFDIIDQNAFITYLVNHGYKREYTVLKTGEFGVKGDIIDIFPIGSEAPYRIYTGFDEVEKIKLFKPDTQLTFGEVSSIKILPMNELFFDDQEKELVIDAVEAFFSKKTLSDLESQKMNQDLDQLYQRKNLDGLNFYMPFFKDSNHSIFDFVENKKIYFIDKYKMAKNQDRMLLDLEEYVKTYKGRNFLDIPFYLKLDELYQYPHIEISGFTRVGVTSDITIHARDSITYQGNYEAYIDRVKKEPYTHLIGIQQPSRYEKLKDLLESKQIDYIVNPETIQKDAVNILYPETLLAFDLVKHGLSVLNESDIFDYKNNKRKIRYKSVMSEAVKISSIEELKTGDYVVHYDYGIGQYLGLKEMELSGTIKDYLHIAYEGTDYLYIPVDQIDKVLRYSSKDGHEPKLTKLGTNQWSNTKKKVKNKLKDISDKLIALYKEREQAVGYEFVKDNELQQAFEANFEFDETLDQLKSIDSVKRDMESKKPMDRLLIGDVGYGKTEVAMRAAFKAVISDKQVAYLVPTTVLARQHFYAFKKRFESFGVTVELLSRFVSQREQTDVLDRLRKGLVDVIIGTHRLLSKDIKFKDLGLLIIDEEQRFGVEHKERIKEMRINIDCLSLSATPIPRTLQMALMGIKDLSMIETPPLNRYPIQTYVVERQDAIIKEAIERELSRAGQVFYLYNKVSDIELVVKKLQLLVPDAKVTFAHGKMSKDKIEDVITDFIDRKFDVLVSTTIIETGIDIPNTNTLLIHDADTLGLSQLYQIRGRVGRSDKIAYAYLMYARHKVMTEDAMKRLKTIQDFTELGSGFKIAMRDLSIRGAGDILGGEQSGFIDTVGMEMYLRLLEETMDEKQGVQKPEPKEEKDLVLSNRHISKDFIDNDEVRVAIHKRISGLNTLNDVKNLQIELEDRFGTVDDELIIYMYEKVFKKLSAKLGVEKTIKSTTDVTLVLSVEVSQTINGESLFLYASEVDANIKLSYLHDRIHISLLLDQNNQHYLYRFIEYLTLVTKHL
ncbi:MAG: transcription-repair coupling factor [Acholeplasma sp.]|nr:transcription-repair coupling factor [Acholeplasma sp.]